MNIFRALSNLFTTRKINVNSSDSARNLALAVGEVATGRSYDLTANPTGSFRAFNLDPQVRILSGAPAITRPLYGANLKIELNGTTGTSKTGGVFAINCYGLITGSGHTVDKNVGISVLADCGGNLLGTTVTENTSLEVFGVASRGSTVITNSRAITVTPPNHGTNRRGLLIAAEGTSGLAIGTNNIAFENLGTSRFVGVAEFVGGLTTTNSTFTSSSIPTTTASEFKLFVDSADSILKIRNPSSGIVYPTVNTNRTQQFTAKQGVTSSALTITSGVITANLLLSNLYTVTLNANITNFTVTNLTAGSYAFQLTQDATGGRTVTFNSSIFKFSSNANILNTTANAINIISCYSFDGITLVCVINGGF